MTWERHLYTEKTHTSEIITNPFTIVREGSDNENLNPESCYK